jgi:Arc/MetJ-type ribon-helix-helix transcriptional regulator
MDVISIRLEKPLSKKIDQSMVEFDYSTKTEFIRDAIRTKLNLLKEEKLKQKQWEKLFALKGSVKPKSSDPDDFLKWREREDVQREMMNYYEKKFNIKLD